MIKIENTEVMGWDAAIRGCRNPKNSWKRSDSIPCKILKELTDENYSYRCAGCRNEYVGRPNCIVIGPNDLKLMTTLRNAGTDHRKFMRMITVYMDVTAPLYWWKEMDQYRVGQTTNSCSTMHKIADKEFDVNDFSHEHIEELTGDEYNTSYDLLLRTVDILNYYRQKYLETKIKPMKEEAKRAPLMKTYWWQMIQLLPTSYNQRRTVMLNYEVLANIYKSRRNHKLDEWHTFCDWIESLPYSELITGEFNENKEN